MRCFVSPIDSTTIIGCEESAYCSESAGHEESRCLICAVRGLGFWEMNFWPLRALLMAIAAGKGIVEVGKSAREGGTTAMIRRFETRYEGRNDCWPFSYRLWSYLVALSQGKAVQRGKSVLS